MLHRHDVAESSALDHIAEGLKEGSEAQYMADVKGGLRTRRRLDQVYALLQCRSHRLFGQDVVPGRERAQDVAVVSAIRGRDDRSRSNARHCEQRIRVPEAMAFGNSMGIGKAVDAIGARVGHRHDPESVGVVEGPAAVDMVASLTGADEDRIGHVRQTRVITRGYRYDLTKETPDARRHT
jgi:hypothetical protein